MVSKLKRWGKAKRGADVARDLTFVTALSQEACAARLNTIADRMQMPQLAAQIEARRFEITYNDQQRATRFARGHTWIVRFVGSWAAVEDGMWITGRMVENDVVRQRVLHGGPRSVLGSMALGMVIAVSLLLIMSSNSLLPNALLWGIAITSFMAIAVMQTMDDRTKRFYQQTVADQREVLREAVYRTLYTPPGESE